MTLADERAAIRRGVSDSRSSSVQRDLQSLAVERRQVRELVTLERRGARPATKGKGYFAQKPKGAGTGGGIASPLVETAFSDREWWDGWWSSDGLFYHPILKKVVFRDANNAEVVQQWATPNPPVTP